MLRVLTQPTSLALWCLCAAFGPSLHRSAPAPLPSVPATPLGEAPNAWTFVDASPSESSAAEAPDPAPIAGVERRSVGPVQIQARDDLAALPVTGTGTAADPFVLANVDVVDSSGSVAFGVYWSDPDADYHLRLENVRIRGFARQQVYVHTRGHLELVGCELSAPGVLGASGVRVAGGTVSISATEFSALGGDGIQIDEIAPARVAVADSRFVEDRGPWSRSSRVLRGLQTSPRTTVALTACEITAASLTTCLEPGLGGIWEFAHCTIAVPLLANVIAPTVQVSVYDAPTEESVLTAAAEPSRGWNPFDLAAAAPRPDRI